MSRQVLTSQAIELDAFARLMRAHTLLRRELETEVLPPHGLTINDFEALLHLSRAESSRCGGSTSPSCSCSRPSGVTRLLDGLQAAGLVENVQCEDDARGHLGQLTDEGQRHARSASASTTPTLLRALFRERLDDDEVDAARPSSSAGCPASAPAPASALRLDGVLVGDREHLVEDGEALVELLARDRERRARS